MKKTPFSTDVSTEELIGLGLTAFGYIHTSEIFFSEEVRQICARNQCQNYGKTWACPPAVGTFEECRDKCLSYSYGFVFASSYELEDSFDFEGMLHGHRQFKSVCDNLHKLLAQPSLLLSNEGCIRCASCTYPETPCRFPEKLFPSLEGYGILVTALAECAGIPYRYGTNSVSYFGLVCYD